MAYRHLSAGRPPVEGEAGSRDKEDRKDHDPLAPDVPDQAEGVYRSNGLGLAALRAEWPVAPNLPFVPFINDELVLAVGAVVVPRHLARA